MAVENQHATPSIDSSATNIAPSDISTPAMSDQVNDDLEKGNRTAEPVDSEKHDVNVEPLAEKSEAVTPAPAGSPGPGPPPDGGLEAWMSVLGAFCGLFVSFGWINCMYNQYHFQFDALLTTSGIGVFQTYYESHQLRDMSTSTVTWITSLETFVMFFAVSLRDINRISTPSNTNINPIRARSSAPSSTIMAPATSSLAAHSSTSSVS